MDTTTYLVFGDLHGRILPAFRLAAVWAREHSVRLAGILQVGDLGWFPDLSRLDRATARHAEKDPLELGATLVCQPGSQADSVFADPHGPDALWFTAGNHEDYQALAHSSYGGDDSTFPVDHYLRLRCVRDGSVAELRGGPRVGALWGIDDKAPNARRHIPAMGKIRSRNATRLAAGSFDVLLTHESNRDAVYHGSGSEEIGVVIRLARPQFHFFGHYGGTGRLVEIAPCGTESYLMAGFELRERGGTAEAGSVGVLRWKEGGGEFDYLDPKWLRTFTRFNWRDR